MRQIITAKLKLETTPGQHHLLRQTQLAYRDALNFVSQWAFAHGKTSNAQRLHQELYNDLRIRFGLLSQMACSAIRQVGATYRGLWTKYRSNIKHRKAKYTRKRFKGLEKPPKFVSPTLTYTYGRDYSFKPGAGA
jgi:putative transposase